MGTIRNWCSVIQAFSSVVADSGVYPLPEALVSLGCSGMKFQSRTSVFYKVPNSVGCSFSGAGVLLHILSPVWIFSYNF